MPKLTKEDWDAEDSDVQEVQFGDPELMYGPEDDCMFCHTSPCDADRYYFGVCPRCHHTDGYVNAGSTHIFICREHKTRWIVGSNLMSSWRNETQDEQRALYDQIGVGEFEEVYPYCSDLWTGPSASGTIFSVKKFSLSPVDDLERKSADGDKQQGDFDRPLDGTHCAVQIG